MNLAIRRNRQRNERSMYYIDIAHLKDGFPACLLDTRLRSFALRLEQQPEMKEAIECFLGQMLVLLNALTESKTLARWVDDGNARDAWIINSMEQEAIRALQDIERCVLTLHSFNLLLVKLLRLLLALMSVQQSHGFGRTTVDLEFPERYNASKAEIRPVPYLLLPVGRSNAYRFERFNLGDGEFVGVLLKRIDWHQTIERLKQTQPTGERVEEFSGSLELQWWQWTREIKYFQENREAKRRLHVAAGMALDRPQ